MEVTSDNINNIVAQNAPSKGFAITDTFSGTQIFTYVVILILAIVLFKRFSIGLNVIFGLFIGYVIVQYLFDKKKYSENVNQIYDEIKKQSIQPRPIKATNYPDITNFLFSVQDLYKYNQQTYEEVVDAIDDFLYLYEEASKLNELAGINYGIMDQKKIYAMNCLHSLIYELPASKQYTAKLNESFDILEKLLNNYLEEIYEINNRIILANGYDNETIIINKNELKPYAYYKNDFYGNYFQFF